MSNSPTEPFEGSTIDPIPDPSVAKVLGEFLGAYRAELIAQGFDSEQAYGLIVPQVVDLVRNVQITIHKAVDA
jgi:hypothetical protein